MIHHLSLGTNDLDRAGAFYDAVLAVVGIRRMAENDRELNYGVGTFLISLGRPVNGEPAAPGNGVHVAFAAEDRAMVDRFHEVALAHGGTDEGAPGLRPEYDANYYGAFVRDPDGNKLEAVTHSAK